MGRTLPTECEHGRVIDYGDFGHANACDVDHPGQPCPDYPVCPDCEDERDAAFIVEARRDAVLDRVRVMVDGPLPYGTKFTDAINEVAKAWRLYAEVAS